MFSHDNDLHLRTINRAQQVTQSSVAPHNFCFVAFALFSVSMTVVVRIKVFEDKKMRVGSCERFGCPFELI
jgi:hypothetical protein